MIDPRKLHQLEQETGPMHDMAYKIGAYHRSLVAQGFSREEALQIVIGYQSDIVISALGGS
jgi:hypothetical protein